MAALEAFRAGKHCIDSTPVRYILQLRSHDSTELDHFKVDEVAPRSSPITRRHPAATDVGRKVRLIRSL